MSVLSEDTATSRFGAVLGYLGAFSSFTAYSLYAVFLLQGKADTNVVTWALWALESILGFHIYRKQVNSDFPKYVEDMVAAAGCCAVTILLFGRALIADVDIWSQLALIDAVSVVLFLAVLYIYLTVQRVEYATLAFQGVLVFSSIPLVRTVYANPTGEPLLPWIFWTLGFSLQLLCVITRNNGESRYSFLTPINYTFWHGTVAVIVLTSSGYLTR